MAMHSISPTISFRPDHTAREVERALIQRTREEGISDEAYATAVELSVAAQWVPCEVELDAVPLVWLGECRSACSLKIAPAWSFYVQIALLQLEGQC
eukprot:1984012-Rhodomonas_salina.2